MEENELNLDNIIGSAYEVYDGSQSDTVETDDNEEYIPEEEEEETTQKKNKKEKQLTETIDDDNEEERSESVGEEEFTRQDAASLESDGDSSASQFYSSIANALREDGIFENIGDVDLSEIEDADDFRALIEQEVNNRLSASEKSIKDALVHGIQPEEIVRYQNMINYLEGLSESAIEDESEDGSMLRKRLIFQDYINRGFSQERALKEVDKSFAAGTDIEDAKEAHAENLNFYKSAYNEELESRKAQEKAMKDAVIKQTKELENLIMSSKDVFDGVQLDKKTRERIFDTVSKPSVKGKDGQRYTKLQAYQMENPNDFIYKIGVLYELTDGFKNIDKLVKSKVIKKQNENIKNLERALKNQNVNYGEPRYISNGASRDVNNKSRYSLL